MKSPKLAIQYPEAPKGQLAGDGIPLPKTNPIEAFSKALRDIEIARDQLRGLLVTDNRHGGLQVALMALRRCEAAVLSLIDVEEA